MALGSGYTLMLDGVALPLKDHVHSLGVLLDLALLIRWRHDYECILPVSADAPDVNLSGKERPEPPLPTIC